MGSNWASSVPPSKFQQRSPFHGWRIISNRRAILERNSRNPSSEDFAQTVLNRITIAAVSEIGAKSLPLR
jgi:hypothetical protein